MAHAHMAHAYMAHAWMANALDGESLDGHRLGGSAKSHARRRGAERGLVLLHGGGSVVRRAATACGPAGDPAGDPAVGCGAGK